VMKRHPGRHRPPVRQPARPPTAITSPADRAVTAGLQHHQAGRFAEAEAHYQQALALDAAHAEALHLLGLIAHQTGQHDLAVGLIGRAIISADDRPWYYLNIGAALQALGRLDLAVLVYRAAIDLRPAYPEAFNNLGVALQAQGNLDEAIPCFQQAIRFQPAYHEAHFNLGVGWQAAGRDDFAVASYRAALAHRPAYPAAQYNLGNALRTLGQLEDAAASYRAALALDPAYVDAQNNLGVVLQQLDARDEAIACFARTIALQPAYPNAHSNLAHLLRERGRPDEAIAAYRRALELRPDDAEAHSGLILVLDHHPACTPDVALAERRAWNERHARALTAIAPPHTNDLHPDRPLRVGYVSGDFRWHSAAMGFGPILAHDPRQVEAICYADVARPDTRTAWFASQAPRWRDVAGWSDAAIAEQIRADQIDILVDLGGHSASGRLLVFARKPAPIQVTAWGYATSTGLDAMDAFLVDPVVAPPDEQRWYVEELVQLPSVVCYEPPANLPAVVPPPSIERGVITFGSLNRATKLTPAALDAWARIVAAVPGSRMLFKSPGLDDAENLSRILDAFAAHGVAPDRIDVLGTSTQPEHLAAFGRVDVQLDPFAHSGGVTTFEGLLTGVPTVTLRGDRVANRLSASFLATIGLPDLVAETVDEYVAIASGLAERADWLVTQRATLRQRVLASPLGNVQAYTRAVEAAYRTLWQRYCAGRVSTEQNISSEAAW
jgi:protein O-GlcNAc transferase